MRKWLAHLALAVAYVLLLNSGCSGPDHQGSSAGVWKPFRSIWKPERRPEPPRWFWLSAIPAEAERADLLEAVLPQGDVLAVIPELSEPAIELASARSGMTEVRVLNVGGHEIRNLADLFDAEKEVSQNQETQIDFLIPSATSPNRTIAAEVTTSQLLGVSQLICNEQSLLRITRGGNPGLLIRERDVRCEVVARVERIKGVLQLGLSLQSCCGEKRLLPVEVKAYANGEALHCLNAMDALELMYGEVKPVPSKPENHSFATVATSDEYRIPSNYQRLNEETVKAYHHSFTPPQPAFASLNGFAYPGPAVLGDARALSGFLMQPEMYRAEDAERSGWILFASEQLKNADAVTLVLDLGNGPRQLLFRLPRT